MSSAQRAREAVMRQTSLTFALQGAAQRRGTGFRSSSWIRAHVEGYEDKSDEAFSKMLQRDIQRLRRAGVPIKESTDPLSRESSYGIDLAAYTLAPIDFSPEEAHVVRLAASFGHSGTLVDFGMAAWTKIAAAGAQPETVDAPVLAGLSAHTDLHTIDPQIISQVAAGIRNGLRIRFDYRASEFSTAQRRIMDPWAMVNYDNRLYLCGWDTQREAPRTFRLRNITNIKADHERATHLQPTADPQQLVQELVEGREQVSVMVRIAPGSAAELAHRATTPPEHLAQQFPGAVYIPQCSHSWIVRTAAGFAPDVVVLYPESVRQDIRAILESEGSDG